MVRPYIPAAVLLFFLVNTLGPVPLAQAQDFHLPAPGVMVHLSLPLNPPILKGIKIHPDNPFRFDFILDQGDSSVSPASSTNERSPEGQAGTQYQQLKQEASKLIKYFLASLTIPEEDLWVNLSPYEKDRIIPQSFGLTEMGRDLLAEDYMLKQITASLIYPEDEIGKKFWQRIYEEAAKKFGTTNISVNTFNKVWIVPEKAIVYENAKAATAYVVESKLKVMLEEDYLSLEKHEGIQSKKLPTKDTNQLGSQIIREIVIPELTKEVNENKNFIQLRQVYNSLILAVWYKKKIKDSILSQVYENKNKVAGVNVDDPQEKEKIYQRYLKAFKKGVFNYIKEETFSIPGMPGNEQGASPRKYFSGGMGLTGIDAAMTLAGDSAMFGNKDHGLFKIDAGLNVAGLADHAIAAAYNRSGLINERIIQELSFLGQEKIANVLLFLHALLIGNFGTYDHQIISNGLKLVRSHYRWGNIRLVSNVEELNVLVDRFAEGLDRMVSIGLSPGQLDAYVLQIEQYIRWQLLNLYWDSPRQYIQHENESISTFVAGFNGRLNGHYFVRIAENYPTDERSLLLDYAIDEERYHIHKDFRVGSIENTVVYLRQWSRLKSGGVPRVIGLSPYYSTDHEYVFEDALEHYFQTAIVSRHEGTFNVKDALDAQYINVPLDSEGAALIRSLVSDDSYLISEGGRDFLRLHLVGDHSLPEHEYSERLMKVASNLIDRGFRETPKKEDALRIYREAAAVHEVEHKVRQSIRALYNYDVEEEFAELASMSNVTENPPFLLSHVVDRAVDGRPYAWSILRRISGKKVRDYLGVVSWLENDVPHISNNRMASLFQQAYRQLCLMYRDTYATIKRNPADRVTYANTLPSSAMISNDRAMIFTPRVKRAIVRKLVPFTILSLATIGFVLHSNSAGPISEKDRLQSLFMSAEKGDVRALDELNDEFPNNSTRALFRRRPSVTFDTEDFEWFNDFVKNENPGMNNEEMRTRALEYMAEYTLQYGDFDAVFDEAKKGNKGALFSLTALSECNTKAKVRLMTWEIDPLIIRQAQAGDAKAFHILAALAQIKNIGARQAMAGINVDNMLKSRLGQLKSGDQGTVDFISELIRYNMKVHRRTGVPILMSGAVLLDPRFMKDIYYKIGWRLIANVNDLNVSQEDRNNALKILQGPYRQCMNAIADKIGNPAVKMIVERSNGLLGPQEFERTRRLKGIYNVIPKEVVIGSLTMPDVVLPLWEASQRLGKGISVEELTAGAFMEGYGDKLVFPYIVGKGTFRGVHSKVGNNMGVDMFAKLENDVKGHYYLRSTYNGFSRHQGWTFENEAEEMSDGSFEDVTSLLEAEGALLQRSRAEFLNDVTNPKGLSPQEVRLGMYLAYNTGIENWQGILNRRGPHLIGIGGKPGTVMGIAPRFPATVDLLAGIFDGVDGVKKSGVVSNHAMTVQYFRTHHEVDHTLNSPPTDLAPRVFSKGGIDLATVNKNLQTRSPSGEIKFHIDPAQFAQFQNAPGFEPEVIGIQPMTNLYQFLGIQDHDSLVVPKGKYA